MNSVGIAIVAMLLGSNIGYAIDNYGILVNNLSFAVMSSTGGTYDPKDKHVEYIDETDLSWQGTTIDREINTSVEQCDILVYARNFVTSWDHRRVEAVYESDKSWNFQTEIGGKLIKYTPDSFNIEGKKGKNIMISVDYDFPVCRGSDGNCCRNDHMEKNVRNIVTAAGLVN